MSLLDCVSGRDQAVSLSLLDKAFVEVFEIADAPVAQLDRASDFGSGGWGFNSLRAHQ